MLTLPKPANSASGGALQSDGKFCIINGIHSRKGDGEEASRETALWLRERGYWVEYQGSGDLGHYVRTTLEGSFFHTPGKRPPGVRKIEDACSPGRAVL